MVHAFLVVLLIGLGDALNPATLGPGMYLATVESASRRIREFLIGFLAVNLVGGLILVFGPGQLVLAVLPKPSPTAKHIIELVAGVILLAGAIGTWAGRRALRRHTPPTFSGGKRTGVELGAGIAAVELPTAFPYFAAVAVIVGSVGTIPGKFVLLIVYNAAFLSPILAILATVIVLGDAAEAPLRRINHWVLWFWPHVLAGLAAVIGIALVGLGLTAL